MSFTLHDPLTQTGIFCMIKGFIGGVYLIGTPIAALWLIIAGFLLVKARGNSEGIARARENLWKVVIGVVLFMSSWLLGVTIVNTISQIIPGIFPGTPSC